VPSDDDIRDPRGFRWVEAGVSGLAREREWDATAIVEVRELAATDEAEIDFRLLADGSVIGNVQPTVLAELTKALGIEPPYAARAVRQSETEWVVGALRFESELVELPAGIEALTLEVAVPPEGEAMYIVNGDVLAEPEGVEAEALERLAELGAARFQAFAARADRLEDGRWELTVDPL
jgi:hypothetical protein